MKTIFRRAIIAGIIVYAWGMLSWLVLPWHNRVIHTLDHDVDVVRMLDFGAAASGVYWYPPMAAKETRTDGPAAFVAIRKEGVRPMGQAIFLGIMLQLLGGFLFAWLLSKTTGLGYGQTVLFASAYGLAVGLLGTGPNWVWLGFAPGYSLVVVLDCVISWTLAGLAVGKVR